MRRITRPRGWRAQSLRVTFIGHASFLIQTGGVNILLDPQFSERASPFPLLGRSG